MAEEIFVCFLLCVILYQMKIMGNAKGTHTSSMDERNRSLESEMSRVDAMRWINCFREIDFELFLCVQVAGALKREWDCSLRLLVFTRK